MKFLAGKEVELRLDTVKTTAKSSDRRDASMTFALVLTDDVAQSLPRFLAVDYRCVRDVESAAGEIKLLKDVELQTIDFNPVPKHKSPVCTLPSVNLTDLVLKREVEKKNENIVVLYFTVKVPLDKHIWSFIFDYLGRSVFARFYETQEELPMDSNAPAPIPSKSTAKKAKAAKRGR